MNKLLDYQVNKLKAEVEAYEISQRSQNEQLANELKNGLTEEIKKNITDGKPKISIIQKLINMFI